MWGLKLLYLQWFWSFSISKFARFGNHCIYLSGNPKTTRVTAIRIFITPRKEQKVLKPLSSFIFIKNVCDRVREGEGEANGTIQFSTFPFPPHIRTATFYAVSLSQSLSSVPVPVPLSLRSPFSLPSPQIITPTFYAMSLFLFLFLSLSLSTSTSLPHPILMN